MPILLDRQSIIPSESSLYSMPGIVCTRPKPAIGYVGFILWTLAILSERRYSYSDYSLTTPQTLLRQEFPRHHAQGHLRRHGQGRLHLHLCLCPCPCLCLLHLRLHLLRLPRCCWVPSNLYVFHLSLRLPRPHHPLVLRPDRLAVHHPIRGCPFPIWSQDSEFRGDQHHHLGIA